MKKIVFLIITSISFLHADNCIYKNNNLMTSLGSKSSHQFCPPHPQSLDDCKTVTTNNNSFTNCPFDDYYFCFVDFRGKLREEGGNSYNSFKSSSQCSKDEKEYIVGTPAYKTKFYEGSVWVFKK